MEFICFILAVFLIVFMTSAIYYMNKSHKAEKNAKQPEQEEPADKEPLPYKAAKLLTPKEYAFFKALQPIAVKYNLLICPKVRLADLIEIPKNTANYMRWFGYIKSKHVDFTICDINLNVKFIVEVDDSTHDKPDRQKRDEFVDSVFQAINIKIIHLRQWGPELEQTICSALALPEIPAGN